jgi:uncharacterized protein YgbK (DUF1537 family)/ribulose-5-phosphate 4-epimerase/fuculose-1-phosphate aldolase
MSAGEVPGDGRLGCVADDYTGGTDVASALRRQGLRTLLLFGPPRPDWGAADADAVVVALKSHNLPPAEAVAVSLAAQRWLTEQGIGQLFFKYCSTFDSTDDGNIGPVADALLDGAGARFTVVCPTSPEHGRTVHQGHLSVGDRLLSESSMRHHPLTPMTDPDLVRVLGRQTPHRVALVPSELVRQGPMAVAAAFAGLRDQGARFAVTDATTDDDLATIATASRDLPVVTGAAGLVRHLGAGLAREDPAVRRQAPRRGSVAHRGKGSDQLSTAPLPGGSALILAGSSSVTTLEQVARARERFSAYRLDPVTTPDLVDLRAKAVDWIGRHLEDGTVLVYASASPSERDQATPGASRVIELTMAELARAAVGRGVRRIVVAGGETSGAVVDGLGIDRVVVAREEDLGVPWLVTSGPGPTGPAAQVGQLRPSRPPGPGGGGVLMTSDSTDDGDERAIRNQLVELGASLFDRRLTSGRTGNLGVRFGDGILMTPTGSSLGGLEPGELAELRPDGSHLGGPPPSKEAFLHLAMYRARPRARAVVHLHSAHAVAVSCLDGVDPDDVLPPLTAYYVIRVGRLPLLPYHAPGDPALGPVAERVAAGHHALLLANHGPIVAAADLATAADAIEELEETARLFLLLHGHPTRPLTDDQAERLRANAVTTGRPT